MSIKGFILFFPFYFVFSLLIYGFGDKAYGTGSQSFVFKSALFSIKKLHYDPKNIDDKFSEAIFNDYIQRMDPNKQYFLSSDIERLSRYKFRLDDEVRSILKRATVGTGWILDENYSFYLDVKKIYDKQLNLFYSFYKNELDMNFNFNVDEFIQFDSELKLYCNTLEELKSRWRKLIKFQVMNHYLNKLESIVPLSATSNLILGNEFVVSQNLLTKSKEKILKNYDQMFVRLFRQNEDRDFTLYLNTIIQLFDPHSIYLAPQDKENFDIGITGTLEGIGAVLTEEDGFIKVVKIVPGSASWRQKELQAGDIILRVAQGDKESVDVVNMGTSEAVKLIRGKKGTVVKLTVKKPDERVIVIPIERDIVVIEETYARFAYLTDKRFDKKLGYIYLPVFYRDFSDSSARNSSDDVRKALLKFKNENVDGVILDLRNNGGGALVDAVKLSGLFIKKGPIVQVNTRANGSSTPKVYRDFDSNIYYDGPLVILVNYQSASSSEILAAALQDYDRAIIIGTKNSYGKGTVQQLVDLNNFRNYFFYSNSEKKVGTLKLTVQKFYRINGGSTQYKGIIPDIILPDIRDYVEVGERTLDHSLRWDRVSSVSYVPWNRDVTHYDSVLRKRKAAIEKNEIFNTIKSKNLVLKEFVDDQKRSLNLKESYKYRLKKKNVIVTSDDLKFENSHLKVLPEYLDLDIEKPEYVESFSSWYDQLDNDLHLNEAVQFLNEIIR